MTIQKTIQDKTHECLSEIVKLRGQLNKYKTECNNAMDSGTLDGRRRAEELSKYIDFYYELICCRQFELDFLDRSYCEHEE